MTGSALATGFGLLTGPQLADQLGQSVERNPEAIRQAEEDLSSVAWGRSLLNAEETDQISRLGGEVLGSVTGVFGAAFGFVGVLLATPVLVVISTLVQMLYVEDVLGEPVTPLADHE